MCSRLYTSNVKSYMDIKDWIAFSNRKNIVFGSFVFSTIFEIVSLFTATQVLLFHPFNVFGLAVNNIAHGDMR